MIDLITELLELDDRGERTTKLDELRALIIEQTEALEEAQATIEQLTSENASLVSANSKLFVQVATEDVEEASILDEADTVTLDDISFDNE